MTKRMVSFFLCLLLLPVAAGAQEFCLAERIEGADIPLEEITDFYYTYDASTDPPRYQRYRLYMEDGKHFLYHETRSGEGWPQTEENIICSGVIKLTEDQWAAFCELLSGGSASLREEVIEDGNAGPWLFIYWNGGEEEGREFKFESWVKESAFEAMCAGLAEEQEKNLANN